MSILRHQFGGLLTLGNGRDARHTQGELGDTERMHFTPAGSPRALTRIEFGLGGCSSALPQPDQRERQDASINAKAPGDVERLVRLLGMRDWKGPDIAVAIEREYVLKP